MSTILSSRITPEEKHNASNNVHEQDIAAHSWYRFVLSFPPHLVRKYIREFGIAPGATLLDPFCGTGTTLVEAKKLGICAVGLEPSHMPRFATQVKLNWAIEPQRLLKFADQVAQKATECIASHTGPRRTLSQDQMKLLISNSICPEPLHKTMILRDAIHEGSEEPLVQCAKLALARVLVSRIGNLHFGPEVGVGKPKVDMDVIAIWLEQVKTVAKDLVELSAIQSATSAEVMDADARSVGRLIQPGSIDAVVTSPPYPNEKDYTRATRLESVILGFLSNREDVRSVKQKLVRSNSKNMYKGDDDDAWVLNHDRIQVLAKCLEDRRLELNKTSGFERLYPSVAKQYFGGMARHLAGLRLCLKPGASLAYVVGDQASYFRIMIRTGEILGEIAESLGYQVVRRDLFRTRYATATGENLREEVLILRWPGVGHSDLVSISSV
ncbi:MAG TPA: DNA methyltransferase [Fimbriimonas sp.]|nr:DNA methyltransferase [Fimbriimonas sp.]